MLLEHGRLQMLLRMCTHGPYCELAVGWTSRSTIRAELGGSDSLAQAVRYGRLPRFEKQSRVSKGLLLK